MFGFGKSRKKGNDPRTGRQMPQSVQDHRKRECIRIGGTNYYQDALGETSGDTIDAIVSPWPDGFNDHKVTLAENNQLVGSIGEDQRIMAGVQSPSRVTLEVARPRYFGESEITLYLPRSKRISELRETATTVNVDEGKWLTEFEYRNLAFDDVEMVEVAPKGKGKPSLAIVADGKRRFLVTPRMKAYKLLEEHIGDDIAAMFVNFKSGRNGNYYVVEILFC